MSHSQERTDRRQGTITGPRKERETHKDTEALLDQGSCTVSQPPLRIVTPKTQTQLLSVTLESWAMKLHFSTFCRQRENSSHVPMHRGARPPHVPDSVWQCLRGSPMSLKPFTQEYSTNETDWRFTTLETGCSGSPHMVTSERKYERSKMMRCDQKAKQKSWHRLYGLFSGDWVVGVGTANKDMVVQSCLRVPWTWHKKETLRHSTSTRTTMNELLVPLSMRRAHIVR